MSAYTVVRLWQVDRSSMTEALVLVPFSVNVIRGGPCRGMGNTHASAHGREIGGVAGSQTGRHWAAEQPLMPVDVRLTPWTAGRPTLMRRGTLESWVVTRLPFMLASCASVRAGWTT